MGMASIRCAGRYRRLGRIALRLKVISPGRYPDLSGPPYARSSNTATPAPKSTTEPSHQRSAPCGTLAARSRRTASTASDGAAEHDDVGVAGEHGGLDGQESEQPDQVRRRVAASSASTAHSSAPVPAAISEASVKVGM